MTSEQSRYNLAVRAVELELIPALRYLGIGLIPYSPLHAGPLAGVLDAARQGRVTSETQHRIDAHRDQLQAYEGLCRDLDAKPADVALAWLLGNPVVSTAIVGATTIEELRSDLGALSVHMDADVMARLDRIWPGPGEAPQAYAWCEEERSTPDPPMHRFRTRSSLARSIGRASSDVRRWPPPARGTGTGGSTPAPLAA